MNSSWTVETVRGCVSFEEIEISSQSCRGDFEWQGGKLLRLCLEFVQEVGLSKETILQVFSVKFNNFFKGKVTWNGYFDPKNLYKSRKFGNSKFFLSSNFIIYRIRITKSGPWGCQYWDWMLNMCLRRTKYHLDFFPISQKEYVMRTFQIRMKSKLQSQPILSRSKNIRSPSLTSYIR